MQEPMIIPVILCGGSGTRLWPLSRKEFPKQFSKLLGNDSLFQATIKRLSGEGFADPVVVSHSTFRFTVAEQLSQMGVSQAQILLEPEIRNTGPAILAAALHLKSQGQDEALMLVAPSDHVIKDTPSFYRALEAGCNAAQAGALVAFGIQPDRAETGYGYLEVQSTELLAQNGTPQAVKVSRFVEKPTATTAEEMLKAKNFLWNAGIFLFRVGDLIAAYREYAPEILQAIEISHGQARTDLGFLRLEEESFATCPNISIDYAIMEKASQVMTVPVSCGWSDLGSWDAVWKALDPDLNGVVSQGEVTALNCTQALLHAEEGGPQLVGLNLEHIAVIAMKDAVLVADLRNMQDVKTAVQALSAKGIVEAETFARVHRPWGWYETLTLSDRFQVKQIMVPPGKKLSLQTHLHRAEHWIIVQGTARITIDEDIKLLTENQSIYIPIGALHRIENPGKVDLHLIEVQTGSYLGEDDIIRYDDDYNRG